MRGSTQSTEWNTVFKMLSKTRSSWRMHLTKASCSEERICKANTRVLATVGKDSIMLLCLTETEKLSRTSTKKFNQLCFLKLVHKFLKLNSKTLGLAQRNQTFNQQSTSMMKIKKRKFISTRKHTMPRPTLNGQSSISMKLRLITVPTSSKKCSFLKTRSSSRWKWTRNRLKTTTVVSQKAHGSNFTKPSALIWEFLTKLINSKKDSSPKCSWTRGMTRFASKTRVWDSTLPLWSESYCYKVTRICWKLTFLTTSSNKTSIKLWKVSSTTLVLYP
jgi:hypothetical protein